MSEAVHAKVGKALCPRYWMHAWFNQSLSQNLGKRQLALFFLPLHFNLSQSDGENGRKEEVGRHRENKEEDPRRILLIREQGNEKRGLRDGE